jgi:hypothetical protein
MPALVLAVVIARLSDEVLVRGSVEMNREDGGSRPATEAIPLASGRWGQPIVSGNPAVPLCAWFVWGGRLVTPEFGNLADAGTRDAIRPLVASGKVRVFLWDPTTENLTEFRQRWKTAVNWINGTEVPRPFVPRPATIAGVSRAQRMPRAAK